MTIATHRKLQYFIVAAVALLLLVYSTDHWSGVSHDDGSIGLAKSKQWVLDTREKLRRSPPEIVVLGNSMVGYGFDDELFSEVSGVPTMNIWNKGAASAWFYLALKNLILQESKPQKLVIIFRDNVLTRPDLRTWGKFKNDIDALVDSDTGLLDELAYSNHKGANYFLSNYVPLYAQRSLWSDRVMFSLEETISEEVLGIETGQLIFSLNRMFSFNGIKYRELGNQSYYQSTRLDPENLRFEENLETSFLPHIVELCKQNDIDLIMGRIQRLVDLEGLRDTRLIDDYMEDFAEYARQQELVLIDSTAKDWLDRSHYSTNDHLVESGKRHFTRQIFKQMQQRNLLADLN